MLRSPLAKLVARRPVAAMAVLLTVLVAAFSGLWLHGSLTLDGPGTTLYVRLATGYLGSIGRVPYWMPEMWGGAPVWALAPSLPVFLLVPVASVFGAGASVKVAILAFQVLGGLGTYVLARSIWGRTAASVVAAIVYALHPFLVSHGALTGSETALAVLAAVPWLAWSLRLGLRGDGTRHLVAAGLIAAFAVLHQAEYAYALVLLCGLLILAEIGRLRGIDSTESAWDVLKRAAVVGGIAFGGVAFWLLPFITLGKSFVLSPPELVRGELSWGLGGNLGREIGVFFTRTVGLTGAVSFDRPQIIPGLFYMGWVCIVLSVITIVLLSRLKGEATLSAVMLVSLAGMWMNTGAVPLAASGPGSATSGSPSVDRGRRRAGARRLPPPSPPRAGHAGRHGRSPGLDGGHALRGPVRQAAIGGPADGDAAVPPLLRGGPPGPGPGRRLPHSVRVPLGSPQPARLEVPPTGGAGRGRAPRLFRRHPALSVVLHCAAPELDAAYQRMSDALAAAGDESRLTTGRLDPRRWPAS